MPGSVSNAAPATVLPNSLYSAFAHSRAFPVIETEYRDGAWQASMAAMLSGPAGTLSRRSWQLAKRLTPAQLAALRTFYFARNGPLEPFYFYDPYETVPLFSYDPTGVATAGRRTVRFDGPWQQLIAFGRCDVPLALVQIG